MATENDGEEEAKRETGTSQTNDNKTSLTKHIKGAAKMLLLLRKAVNVTPNFSQTTRESLPLAYGKTRRRTKRSTNSKLFSSWNF